MTTIREIKNSGMNRRWRQTGYWQAGTLYELPILGLVLMLAGIFLSPLHPGFLALIGLGLLVLFLPSIRDRINRIKAGVEGKRLIAQCAEEFRSIGFSPGLALRGNRSAGVAVFDSTAKRVAMAAPDLKPEVFNTHALREVVLSREEIQKLGGPGMLRYHMTFSFPDKDFTLVFTSRRRARKLFRKVNRLIGGAADLHDRTR